MMIRSRVSPLRLPDRHPPARGGGSVSPRHGMEERGDPTFAPPARRRAAPARRAHPTEGVLGGSGADRAPAQRDTDNPTVRAPADRQTRHDSALAPGHPAPPLGRQVYAEGPSGDPPEHKSPGPADGAGERALGIPVPLDNTIPVVGLRLKASSTSPGIATTEWSACIPGPRPPGYWQTGTPKARCCAC
jgi:hypothetical protein